MPVGDVLLDILVVLVAAKVAAELAERVGVPGVVGEIGAGVLVGPSVLGLVGEDEVLRVLGELGVILLLLDVGMHMDLPALRAVGRPASGVALAGVALPMLGGSIAAGALGQDWQTSVFVGAALTATSVGITARVFGDLRALGGTEARTVLGAAVADDVLGLVILTVVVRLATEGSVSAAAVTEVVVLAVGFLVVVGGLSVWVAPVLFSGVHRLARSSATVVALALAFTLAVAELASAARLAPIVGAFVAGLALARVGQAERIRRELTPVGHLLVPVFFLQIGIDTDVGELVRPEVLGLAAALLAVAVGGKVLAGWAAVGTTGDRLLIGLGMLPRGEVGLIFAGIGLAEGVLGDDLYAALLVVVLVTTLVTPPLLRARLLRVSGGRRGAVPAVAMPAGGWLVPAAREVELAAVPPPPAALAVALEAAVLVGGARGARPGPALLDWLASLPDAPLRWDAATRSLLFDVLRRGSARSWRFLETTGVLERALPELAAVVRRRRADPLDTDPAGALRWSLVESLHDVVDGDPEAHAEWEILERPEWLVLAALVLDAAGDREPPVGAARQLVQRLDLGAAAEQEIALLVGESGLLRAAAERPVPFDEVLVLPIATHLARPERARALFVLSLALGPCEPWARVRLRELHGVVQAVLSRPALGGREARNLAEQRRAEAARLAPRPVATRVATAPRSWLLTAPTDRLARQAGLLVPSPGARELRLAWRRPELDVAARDQVGLLAATTSVLHSAGLQVVTAVVATWPDGAALQSFRLADGAPIDVDAGALRGAMAAALAGPLAAPPVADADAVFDAEASPWFTLCRVDAPDRPGLLHGCALAFAAAGVRVHYARVETVGGRAVDWFELSGARGGKLSATEEEAVRSALATGPRLARPRSSRRAHGGRRIGLRGGAPAVRGPAGP